jgi:hypothetical protein
MTESAGVYQAHNSESLSVVYLPVHALNDFDRSGTLFTLLDRSRVCHHGTVH